MAKKLTITLPDGTTATRTTEREYRFGVAVHYTATSTWKSRRSTWVVETWCSRRDLAEKEASRRTPTPDGFDQVVILPVNGTDEPGKPAPELPAGVKAGPVQISPLGGVITQRYEIPGDVAAVASLVLTPRGAYVLGRHSEKANGRKGRLGRQQFARARALGAQVMPAFRDTLAALGFEPAPEMSGALEAWKKAQ